MKTPSGSRSQGKYQKRFEFEKRIVHIEGNLEIEIEVLNYKMCKKNRDKLSLTRLVSEISLKGLVF